MNFRAGLAEQCDSEKTVDRLVSVASVVAAALGQSITEAQAIALMDILANRTIVLTDGTRWNDPSDSRSEIWIAEAALVASVLCAQPCRRADWWRQRYLVFCKEDGDYDVLLADVADALRNSAAVSEVEK